MSDERRPKYTTRPCMRCHDDFRSAGNHNRLCSNCKEQFRRSDALWVEYETLEARV